MNKFISQEEYEWIVENYINGNISDVKNSIKKLNKKELCRLIKIWADTAENGSCEIALTNIYGYL